MRLRLGVWSTVLVLVVVLAVPSYSGLRDGAFKVKSVDMDGLSRDNTAAFVYGGRFVLVTPHESPGAPNPIRRADIEKLTNNYLSIIDTRITKDAPEPPRTIPLGNCYFPTKVVVDEKRELAVIRATAIEAAEVEKDSKESGDVVSYEVMVAVHLHLTDGKAEATGQPLIIKIPGLNGEEKNPGAPGDMYLDDGKLIFLTGRHVCVFDVDEGSLIEEEIITAEKYGPADYLSLGGFDSATQVLTVVRNMSAEDSGTGKSTHSTELRFYKLGGVGGLSLITRVEPAGFPGGTDYFTPDSEVAILGMSDDSSQPQYAIFGTKNGNLCLVDLATESLVSESRKLTQFPALAQGDGEAGPRIVKVDPSTHTVFTFNPGPVQLNIRRPIFGRPTSSNGIRRPIFVRSSATRVVIAAQINSKSKIVNVSDLSDPMAADVGVSGLVQAVDGGWILAASNGEMFTVGISDLGESKVEKLGDIGHSRVESVAYNVERNSIVALCSSGETGELSEGSSEAAGDHGAVVIAAIREARSPSVALSIARMLSSPVPALGSVTTTIRRPCNIGR